MEPVPAPAEKTVLLVEPDQAARQLYSRALRRYWRVLALRTIDEALAVLDDDEVPQAAVIEPYAGGYQIDWEQLSGLRERLLGLSPVPVILCSTLDERGTGYAWGASAYLLKPVSPDQLVGELTRLLA